MSVPYILGSQFYKEQFEIISRFLNGPEINSFVEHTTFKIFLELLQLLVYNSALKKSTTNLSRTVLSALLVL